MHLLGDKKAETKFSISKVDDQIIFKLVFNSVGFVLVIS